MRLSKKEIEFLKNKLLSMSSDARLYLFGSRVDDSAKGGDIDLLIISKSLTKKDIRPLRIDFCREFGEQKIDIIIDDGSFAKPFAKMIHQKAVPL